MDDEGLVDDLCAACRAGRHVDCDFFAGCQCGPRLGPDGSGVRLCDSLLPYDGEDWR